MVVLKNTGDSPTYISTCLPATGEPRRLMTTTLGVGLSAVPIVTLSGGSESMPASLDDVNSVYTLLNTCMFAVAS